jgi:hypothetical protein
MKSTVRSSPYFSAYPLKAIKESTGAATESPYLKSVLAGRTKASSRVRVLPMINPYRQQNTLFRPVPPAKEVESSGNEWFNHYE